LQFFCRSYIVAGGIHSPDDEGFNQVDVQQDPVDSARRVMAFARHMMSSSKKVRQEHALQGFSQLSCLGVPLMLLCPLHKFASLRLVDNVFVCVSGLGAYHRWRMLCCTSKGMLHLCSVYPT
jgi:hypothetical protein